MKKLNLEKIKKELRTIIWSLGLALGLSVVFGTVAAAQYSERIQTGLAESLIRFHVIANSNSKADQNLKLKVRERLLEEISPLLEGSTSQEESKAVIKANLGLIVEIAEKEIEANGYRYKITAELENCKFPLKKYGELTLPAGYYDALKIEIGEAGGENFWCVLYPAVCFVEDSIEDIDAKVSKEMKEALTQETYEIVMKNAAEETEIVPEIKFKVVEWWQEMKN